MATAKQIQYRIKQEKKKQTKINKELAGSKKKIKALEVELKKTKPAGKAKPKKKVAKKKVAKKK